MPDDAVIIYEIYTRIRDNYYSKEVRVGSPDGPCICRSCVRRVPVEEQGLDVEVEVDPADEAYEWRLAKGDMENDAAKEEGRS